MKNSLTNIHVPLFSLLSFFVVCTFATIIANKDEYIKIEVKKMRLDS